MPKPNAAAGARDAPLGKSFNIDARPGDNTISIETIAF
jgi:hypothetical protein